MTRESDVVINPDDWKAGLRFALGTLNTKKVSRAKKSPGRVLLIALQHNLRKDNEAHRHRRPIDTARTVNNSVLRGEDHPDNANAVAHSAFDRFGIDAATVRVDAIMGIEIVFQPPDGWDVPEFYDACLRWADRRYQHVLSAVVHRDQKRPHMHLIALAVVDGALDGSGMSSGPNRWDAQRNSFMGCMRDTLGLRPDREPKPRRCKSLTSIFTGAGKGPKKHELAAQRDAQLEQRIARARGGHLIAHQPHGPEGLSEPHSPSNLVAHQPHIPDLILRGHSNVFGLFKEGILRGVFSATQTRPMTPAPRPRVDGTPTVARRAWQVEGVTA
jgi:hypothetical protein